jgi:hypothetical protein
VDFFLRGNAEMLRRYPAGFPWRQAGGDARESVALAAVTRDSYFVIGNRCEQIVMAPVEIRVGNDSRDLAVPPLRTIEQSDR